MAERRGAAELAGVRVAVTRTAAQAVGLCSGLEALGAEVISAPLIRIVPPRDPAPLEGAAGRLGWYDWVVFTSSNGVEAFSGVLERQRGGVSGVSGVRVACIGPATAAAAVAAGWHPELVSPDAVAESLLEALLAAFEREGGAVGVRVLLPVAAGARDVLERGLAAAGVEVTRVEAYRTECDRDGARLLLEQLAAGSVDLLLFASPSSVECLASTISRCSGEADWNAVLGGARVGVIGPITGGAARRLGLEVWVEAEEYTAAGLLRAVVERYHD